MNRRKIIKELKKRGYSVEERDLIKNGTIVKGILFDTGEKVKPVIYMDALVNKANPVEEIVSIFEGAENTSAENFLDSSFFLSHIYIGLQKKSGENILKRDLPELEGLEQYLYVRGNGSFLKVTDELLEETGIFVSKAWKKALENTKTETILERFGDLFILSNKDGYRGASAIVNKEVLSGFGRKHQTKTVIVFPTSIHELLLMPYKEGADIDFYSSLVKKVSNENLSPVERLSDKVYVVSV